jgi:hypothetical protein
VRQSEIGHTIAGAGMASAIERIEQESRQSVRALEVDPAADPAAVRRIVEDVIAAYRDRAISMPMPALGDPDLALRAVLDNITGYGPLQAFLDDRTVEEIWINEPGRVFIARRGRSELTNVVLTSEQVSDLVERMLRPSGRRLDLSSPLGDATNEHRTARTNRRAHVARLRAEDALQPVQAGVVPRQIGRWHDIAGVRQLRPEKRKFRTGLSC